jgi:hypothetical protein
MPLVRGNGPGSPTVYQPIVAGDGYAYVVYSFAHSVGDPQVIGACSNLFSNSKTSGQTERSPFFWAENALSFNAYCGGNGLGCVAATRTGLINGG